MGGPDAGQTPEYARTARAKRRAQTDGLPFDLDPTDITIPTCCPVFARPLEIGDGASQDTSPSVDKLDPNKVYVQDNVWAISHVVNRIKNYATLEQLEAVTSALRSRLRG